MNLSEWQKIEADFREWAFRRYYMTLFAEVLNPHERFAQALVASIAPIKDRQAVIEWHRLRKRKRPGKALEQIAANSKQRQASKKNGKESSR